MKFLTTNESAKWCVTQNIELDALNKPKVADENIQSFRVNIPTSINRLTWFSRFIESKLQPRKRCLLWVTDWGIWSSSENWHLYYRLRQSYGDYQLLEEVPGHLFLEHESQDLISFLQIGLVFGWDMHLLPSAGYGRAFISHDGWLEFAMADELELKKIEIELGKILK